MAEDPRAEQKREAALTTAMALVATYGAARANVLGRVARGIRAGLLLDYWTDRVSAANEKALKRIAADTARDISSRVSVPRMDHYLEQGARARAEGWTEDVNARLVGIDGQVEDFAQQVTAQMDAVVAQAPDDAREVAEAAVEFGSFEAEKANGRTEKTWHLGPGDNHRASHAALDGVTIGIDERFANGLRYPHAPGPPAETVNCNCFLTYGGGS